MLNRIFNDDNIVITEKNCISVIEKELDEFFIYCIKSAHDFSSAVSNNLKSFAHEMLEKSLPPAEELKDLIEKINTKVNEETAWDSQVDSISFADIDPVQFTKVYSILEDRIKNYIITQRTADISELIIDEALSQAVSCVCPNRLVDCLVSRSRQGERILGDNNRIKHAERCRQELYKQIEGVMVNIKLQLKEQLIKECIISINKNYDFDDSLIA
jgi:hypothetical protein